MLSSIPTHHYACFGTIHGLNDWPLKTDGYLKTAVPVLPMSIHLILDEIGGKIGFAYKSYINLNVCMFMSEYRHLSRIQTKVEQEEYLNHAWILETERDIYWSIYSQSQAPPPPL